MGLFNNKKKKQQVFDQAKLDYEARKTKVDEYINNYYKQRYFDLDQLLHQEKVKTLDKVHDVRMQCAKDIANYEHEFHLAKQTKNEELAKLDALIEAKGIVVGQIKQLTEANNKLIEAKDAEIERLNDLCDKLATTRENINHKSGFDIDDYYVNDSGYLKLKGR